MTKTAAAAQELAATKKTAATAEAAHRRERERLDAAQSEIAALTAQISETDPDDAEVLRGLVADRDAARGRAEALGAREARARQALEAARADVRNAEESALRVEFDELQEQLRAFDEESFAAVRALGARLLEGLPEAGKRNERARVLATELRLAEARRAGREPLPIGDRDYSEILSAFKWGGANDPLTTLRIAVNLAASRP